MMNFDLLFSDKLKKPKAKVTELSNYIFQNPEKLSDLVAFAVNSKGPIKASCIEAIEFVTEKNPTMLDKTGFNFIVTSLKDKSPRVKWECARVIANTAHLFGKDLHPAIESLFENATNEGTVVRWSVAKALCKILSLDLKQNNTLYERIRNIAQKEKKQSIQKIYLAALNKND